MKIRVLVVWGNKGRGCNQYCSMGIKTKNNNTVHCARADQGVSEAEEHFILSEQTQGETWCGVILSVT